jgi:Ner family transcriptional regulator
MPKDGWHRADIIAAIHKRDTTLLELSRAHRLGDSTLRSALHLPRTPANRIIADFLGVPMHVLWPAWFDSSGALKASRPKPATAARRASSPNRTAA